MACSLSSLPLASFCHWRGWSTAGPSHDRQKIIEIAQTGLRDPAKLSALAIKELGVK
jgi:hypothetical protein